MTPRHDPGLGGTRSIAPNDLGLAPIMDWTLGFDFTRSISSIWNGTIVKHVNNHYGMEYATYNSLILPGQSVSFGFVSSSITPGTGPMDLTLNGIKLS